MSDHASILGAYQADVLGHAQRLGPGLLSCRWGRPAGAEESSVEGIVVTFPHAPSAAEIAAIGTSFQGMVVHLELAT